MAVMLAVMLVEKKNILLVQMMVVEMILM